MASGPKNNGTITDIKLRGLPIIASIWVPKKQQNLPPNSLNFFQEFWGLIVEFTRILCLDAWISLMVFAISMSFSGKFFRTLVSLAGGWVVYSFLFGASKVHIWPTHIGQRWQMRWKRNPRCIGYGVKSHRPKVEEIEENRDGEANLSIRGACR